MASSEAILKIRSLTGDAKIAMLTTESPSGEFHSRPLTLSEIDDQGDLTFLVDSAADWVAGLRVDDEVNVSIINDDDKVWLSIAGQARVTADRATIDRLWTPHAATFFPDGPESATIRVLTVHSKTAEYWDAPSGRVERLAGLASALLGKPDARQGESGSIHLD